LRELTPGLVVHQVAGKTERLPDIDQRFHHVVDREGRLDSAAPTGHSGADGLVDRLLETEAALVHGALDQRLHVGI
jgi:hypothetical protein